MVQATHKKALRMELRVVHVINTAVGPAASCRKSPREILTVYFTCVPSYQVPSLKYSSSRTVAAEETPWTNGTTGSPNTNQVYILFLVLGL